MAGLEESFLDTLKSAIKTSSATAKARAAGDWFREKVKQASASTRMRVLSDEMTDRKEELNDKWGARMNQVEDLILPLLKNLAKDGDKREWIKWPGRTDILNKQIDAITEVTRGDF